MRILIAVAAWFVIPAMAHANCLSDGALRSDEIVSLNMDSSLYRGTAVSTAVASAVQKFAASDPSLIAGIQGAIPGKSLPLQTAITEALAAAAQAGLANNPERAGWIQLAAADLNPDLRSVFERYNRQRQVALAGGARSGSPGSSGGNTSGNGADRASHLGSSGPSDWSVADGPTTYDAIVSSGRDGGNGGTDSDTTIINPVNC